MKFLFVCFLSFLAFHEIHAFKRSWSMYFEDMVDIDAPNNFKIRRHISPPAMKVLKRSASAAELKFKEKHLRPSKRQALEIPSSSEEEEQSSESFEAFFANLGLNDDLHSGEGESPELVEPFCDLSLSDAIIICPYAVPSFKGVSLIDFFNECSFNNYFALLPSFIPKDTPFNIEAMTYFEKQLMVKQLMKVFDVSEIMSLFLVCERACPYIFHSAVERTLRLEPHWINTILSVMFQLCMVPDILGKTVRMLVETKAVQVDLEVLQKACVSFNRPILPETFVSWIKDGVKTTTLSFMIAYCTIDESVLEAALIDMGSPILISLLAQKLPTVRPSLILLAVAREYPDGLINQLLGSCSCPDLIQAARKNSTLLKNLY